MLDLLKPRTTPLHEIDSISLREMDNIRRDSIPKQAQFMMRPVTPITLNDGKHYYCVIYLSAGVPIRSEILILNRGIEHYGKCRIRDKLLENRSLSSEITRIQCVNCGRNEPLLISWVINCSTPAVIIRKDITC